MSDEHDLKKLFERQRQFDHDNAPAWQPALLNRAMPPRRSAIRWIPIALATACLVFGSLFFTHLPKSQPSLSETLPPLFEPSPGELFASREPSFTAFEAPSDYLLPRHLDLHIP